jgi:hypothetical protein
LTRCSVRPGRWGRSAVVMTGLLNGLEDLGIDSKCVVERAA